VIIDDDDDDDGAAAAAAGIIAVSVFIGKVQALTHIFCFFYRACTDWGSHQNIHGAMQVELTRDNRYVFTVTQRFTKKLQGRKQQCRGYDQPMVEIPSGKLT